MALSTGATNTGLELAEAALVLPKLLGVKQPKPSAWQNIKNNLSNAFEMGGDVKEFFGPFKGQSYEVRETSRN